MKILFLLFLFLQKRKRVLKRYGEALSLDKKTEWKKRSTIERALKFIGNFTIHTLRDEDKTKYALQVVENELFPHMGITSTRKEKAFLLGKIVKRLLSTASGLRKEDDRDDYKNKRVDSAGQLCHDLFRQLFKKFTNSIVSIIEKKKTES